MRILCVGGLRLFVTLALFIAFCCVGCGERNPQQSETASLSPKGSVGTQQVFVVKGVIKSIPTNGNSVTIRHEEIPNYMPAMTMPLDVTNRQELTGLKEGDAITFRLHVTDTDSWIEGLAKVGAPNPLDLPSRGSTRVVRDVEPLQVGDAVPGYRLTNELGQVINTLDYHGSALAITFIFTRCPLPNFCPKMSSNFEQVQTALLNTHAGVTNWQLLTLSFDPEFDTPEILRAYAERYHADPRHWHFATGSLLDITAITEQFGQTFWKDQGAINHNLRTVVINTEGKVRKILQGNNWAAEELAEEIVAAASGKAAGAGQGESSAR